MVSFMIAKIFLTMIISTSVLGAPTKALDAATLLENGQLAQKLNVAYRSVKLTDPCVDGNKACILGGVASCQNGAWVVGQGACSKSQACFALPSNQKAATLVTCTTEKNALAAIEATGATGGIFGNSTVTDGSTSSLQTSTATNPAHHSSQTNQPNEDTDPDYTQSSTLSSTRTSSTVFPTPTSTIKTKGHSRVTVAPSTTSPGVVTLTITIENEPTNLAPVTRTLSPEKAFSLLAHLLADGATMINPSASVTSLFPAPSITSSISVYRYV